MARIILNIVLIAAYIVHFVQAQSLGDFGYEGYSLTSTGDSGSTIYSTSSSPANQTFSTPPDVFLNASVHVGEISILVQNLTAKINLDAQVLSLLKFNAGVDLSIDTVRLLIQEVDAEVMLEARLGNLVTMIGDVLDSIDLNPVLAQLGNSIGDILDTTTGVITGESNLATRSDTPLSYRLKNNILFSINDYGGHIHTNRVLAQTGDIVEQSLDDSGNVRAIQVVGFYEEDMQFSGLNRSAVFEGQPAQELEYLFMPFPGLKTVSSIFVNAAGTVLGTKVLSETGGGGSSTIGRN